MSFIGSLYRPSLPPFNPRRAAPRTALEHLHRLRAASRILALVRVVFALVVVLSVALVFALVVVRPLAVGALHLDEDVLAGAQERLDEGRLLAWAAARRLPGIGVADVNLYRQENPDEDLSAEMNGDLLGT